MLRRVLLAASASQRVRRLITTAPLTRDVVTRFVAGDTAAQALTVTERLLGRGLSVTIDYLGEDTTDPDQPGPVRGRPDPNGSQVSRVLSVLGWTGRAGT